MRIAVAYCQVLTSLDLERCVEKRTISRYPLYPVQDFEDSIIGVFDLENNGGILEIRILGTTQKKYVLLPVGQ